jgi:hypothetical protein
VSLCRPRFQEGEGQGQALFSKEVSSK